MELDASEQKYALDLLASTADRLISAVSGLPEVQWRFRPAADRWSVAEILEHIVLLEQAFHSRVVVALQTGSAPLREASAVDSLVISRVPDRTVKYQAPAPLVPRGRWSESEGLHGFAEIRERTITFASDPTGFRDRTVDHPFLGPLDSYQWVLMVALHSARHTEQILEVVALTDAPSTAAAAD